MWSYFSIRTQNENSGPLGKTEEKDKEGEKLIESTPGSGDPTVAISGRFQKMSTLAIVKRTWIWILSVFICFFGTLVVFPAITVLVKSTESGSQWNDVYFIPVGCFLLFNIGDFAGRTLAGIIKINWASHLGSLCLLMLSVVKLAFIPLFLFCNAAPSNRVLTYVSS